MFERFTERARQVVVFAQDEARSLKHNYIGTEHLLLGLLRVEEGLAARVLESLHVPIEDVRAQVARIVGLGDEVATGQIPFTPRAKKVLELSMREALGMGHNYIGTEHVLLGLARENDGVAAQILLDFGVDAEKLRNGVVGALSGTFGTEPPFVPDSPPFASVARAVPVPGVPRFRQRVHGREQRPRSWQTEAVIAGWAMFGVAASLGVLLGWLIWG